MNRVELGPVYFPNPAIGRPISSGDIYVGEPDTDPEVVLNQKQISVQQENGSITPISQPVSTGAGGVPLYNESPVTILVDGDYSLKVLNSAGSQVYYVPSVAYSLPLNMVKLSDYDDLADAVATIGATKTELWLDTDDTLTGSVTSPATLSVRPIAGNEITTSSFTWLCNGPVITGTGAFQWLDTSGGGSVLFGANATTYVNPIWWQENTTPGTTSFETAINQAIFAAANGGIRYVKMAPTNTYAVDPGTATVKIKSGVILDLAGSTLQRIGANATSRMVENFTYAPGTAIDTDLGIENGKLIGTGAPGNISDQGACVGFFGIDVGRIVNIKTEDSNGDGIQYRQADNLLMEDIEVGDFGRNGISPTSGLGGVWRNVKVTGGAITGANPGLDIDAENDSATESTEMTWDSVKAANATFVDFHSSTDFGHEVQMSNVTLGPGFKALRIKSTNATTAKNFIIGDTVTLLSGGTTAGIGLEMDKVGGVVFDGKILATGTASGTEDGIVITNTVENLRCTGAILDPDLDNGILAFAETDLLNNAIFSGCDLGDVYLTGSGNEFKGCAINLLRISRAASIDNRFDTATSIVNRSIANSGDFTLNQFSNFLTTDNSTAVTVGTGEDTLKTYTLPADTLTSEGGIRIKASGFKTGANGNKTIILYWGTATFTFNPAANDTNDWAVDAEITNTTDATQVGVVFGLNGSTVFFDNMSGGVVQDTTSDVIVKVTGECANASDVITIRGWSIERIVY